MVQAESCEVAARSADALRIHSFFIKQSSPIDMRAAAAGRPQTALHRIVIKFDGTLEGARPSASARTKRQNHSTRAGAASQPETTSHRAVTHLNWRRPLPTEQ